MTDEREKKERVFEAWAHIVGDTLYDVASNESDRLYMESRYGERLLPCRVIVEDEP